MNSKCRILNFIAGETVDQTPFMPIFMRFCAQYSKMKYRDFILDVDAHCKANIECARYFRSDWVNVMSDPYCELSAYGAEIEYLEDSLPIERHLLCQSIDDLGKIKILDFSEDFRSRGRIGQCARFKELCGDEQIIAGWVEGPVAEYCDLRGMGDAFLDFYDGPGKVKKAMEIILENAKNFITLQVKAGANCIGIGDAACSQIGRELYLEFGFDGEKMLIEHIHALGAVAKLHICGNTAAILPDMIKTEADIIDIDHLVKDMSPFIELLGDNQVFCGNIDPVSIIQNETVQNIKEACRNAMLSAKGKLILSGGCEITPSTDYQNILAMHSALAI